MRRRHPPQCPGCLRERVLRVLSLVGHNQRETPLPQPLPLPPKDPVGGERHLVWREVVQVTATAVETPHRHRRGEAAELTLPVAEKGRRADHEHRAADVHLRSEQVKGNDLDRLAEPHVVGEAGAEAELGHLMEPRHPAQLIRPQLRFEGRRRSHLRHAAGGELLQPSKDLGERFAAIPDDDVDHFAVDLGLTGEESTQHLCGTGAAGPAFGGFRQQARVSEDERPRRRTTPRFASASAASSSALRASDPRAISHLKSTSTPMSRPEATTAPGAGVATARRRRPSLTSSVGQSTSIPASPRAPVPSRRRSTVSSSSRGRARGARSASNAPSGGRRGTPA